MRKSGWSAFLRHVVDRGLKGVQLIISDACRGLTESAAEYLPEAAMKLLYLALRNIGVHWNASDRMASSLRSVHYLLPRSLADYNPLMLNRHGSVAHN